MSGIAATASSCRLPVGHQSDTGGVHLPVGSVDPGPDRDARRGLLDEHEQARAARFRFERDRAQFVHRRAFVRGVLARYLGLEPAEVPIRTSSMGRPELDGDCGIFFNASHSAGVVAVAVARGRRVGADIERVRPIGDALTLAEGLFTPREIESLRPVPEPSRPKAFLTLWTRRGSLVQAVGDGLSLPLDALEMLQDENGQVRWLRDMHQRSPCAFIDLRQPEGYVGAVTLTSTRVRPRLSNMDIA